VIPEAYEIEWLLEISYVLLYSTYSAYVGGITMRTYIIHLYEPWRPVDNSIRLVEPLVF
jgi:hypothetical protein